MKKIILALITVFAISGVSYANPVNGRTGATENVAQEQVDKNNKERKGKRGDAKKMDNGKSNLFEGINLTEEQKTQLGNLRKSMKAANDAEMKKEEKQNLSDEQKKELKKQKMNLQQENKKKYLEGVKTILTPEQYVQFLENCYLNQGNPQGGKSPMKGNKKPQGKR